MLNPLSLLQKAKRGDLTMDQIMEIFSAAGIEAEFDSVPMAEAFNQFEGLAEAASLPSSSLMRLKLKLKAGQTFDGLLVLSHHAGS